MPPYTLNINGQTCTVDLAPEALLVDALRDELQLLGTKHGCSDGQCGYCIVHLDGVPSRSCMIAVAAVGTRQVTTIEGLDPEANHPLQQAWRELDVPHCGYCQSGQIMSAAALLRANPNPSAQQIDEAMAGNLCRCGTYHRIRAGIRRAIALARQAPSPTR